MPAQLTKARFEPDRDMEQVAVPQRVFDLAGIAEATDVRCQRDYRLAKAVVDP